jgi:hypothetical protein
MEEPNYAVGDWGMGRLSFLLQKKGSALSI